LNHLQFAPSSDRVSNTNGNTNGYQNGNTNGYNNNPNPNNNAPVDMLAMRNQYLSGLPQGPTVDYNNALALQSFFAQPMGAAILKYFYDRSVQPNGQSGLNVYGLSEANFRLWMGIKILAGKDNDLYARSIALDKNLFTEIMQKAQAQQRR